MYHKGIGGDTHHKGMGQAGNKSVLSYRADIGVPGEGRVHDVVFVLWSTKNVRPWASVRASHPAGNMRK